MPLATLLQQLSPGAPGREGAARELLGWLQREVRPGPSNEGGEVVSQVMFALLKRGCAGKASPDDAESYVRAMIRNASISLLQRQERSRPLADAGELPAPPDQTEELARFERELIADEARARALLRELFEALAGTALPRYRAEWQRAFAQLDALVFGHGELRALVTRDDDLDADDEQAIQAALVRAYTAHRRLRERLAALVDSLACAGRIPPARAEAARACLALFIRAGVRRGEPARLP